MFTRNLKLSHLYLAHYTVHIVLKQLHSNKQENNTMMQTSLKYDTNSDSTVKKDNSVIILVKLVQCLFSLINNFTQ